VRILVSIVCRDEIERVLDPRISIIDVKDVEEGALGAARPEELLPIAKAVAQTSFELSASIGEATFPPGPTALAAVGAASLGARWVKVALGRREDAPGATTTFRAIRRALDATSPETRLVAAGYADAERFGAVTPRELLAAAAESRCDAILLDTRAKNGACLFDFLAPRELRELACEAHERKLRIALAGSISERHLETLAEIGPDLIGVRGALCAGDRRGRIDRAKVERFLGAVERVGGGSVPRIGPALRDPGVGPSRTSS